MKGQCKLFGFESEMQESHIYPRFVIKFMKKTGGTNYIRNVTNPNKREQDGLKRYWLSKEAEQKFGIREKWFSENIFLPYIENNQKHFEYDERLFISAPLSFGEYCFWLLMTLKLLISHLFIS